MKKIILTSLMSVGALGAYAQGLLSFTDYDYGVSQSEIYSPSTASPTTATPSINGFTTADVPWNGASASQSAAQLFPGSVPLGGSASGATTPTDYAKGSLWSVQVEAVAATSSTPLPLGPTAGGVAGVSLGPIAQYTTTMNTSGNAGFINQSFFISGDPGIPGTGLVKFSGNGGTADVAVAAWYNGSGDTSLAQAQADPSGVWGVSSEVTDFALTEPSSQTSSPIAPGQPFDVPVDSFALQTVNISPEPSTIALGVLGVCAFMARRKKN